MAACEWNELSALHAELEWVIPENVLPDHPIERIHQTQEIRSGGKLKSLTGLTDSKAVGERGHGECPNKVIAYPDKFCV
jgi:hypothetical protein